MLHHGAAAAAAAAAAASLTMLDHNDANIDELPGAEMRELASGCRAAAAEWLQRRPGETVPLQSRIETPVPHATPRGDAVSIAYLVMAHRRFAHATVARTVRALWAPEHLFLVHFDLRANASAVSWLRGKLEAAPNVRFMSHRRAVGWGAFSMVEVMLEAMATALRSAPAFDFFINLSDADLPLRTGAELGAFLGRFRGRSFVSVKFPAADEMRYQAHQHMRRWSWLECSGRGFLVINQSAGRLFENEQRCAHIHPSSAARPEPHPSPPSTDSAATDARRPSVCAAAGAVTRARGPLSTPPFQSAAPPYPRAGKSSTGRSGSCSPTGPCATCSRTRRRSPSLSTWRSPT